MEEIRAREIGEQDARRDRKQQQRLEAFFDRKIYKYADDDIHDQRFAEISEVIIEKLCDPRAFPQG